MGKSKEPLCPLIKKPCLQHGCAWYGHMTGNDPQTGAPLDMWDCSVKWIPVLITEQARQTKGVQAAVESTRNELVSRQDTLNGAVKGAAQALQMAAVGRIAGQVPPPAIEG
jgi:hypothetical protein